jgi:predicted acetyltransferase
MKLIYPSKTYLESYNEARKEYEENNITTYYFSDSNSIDIFKKFKLYRLGKNLPPNRVRAITYWLIDKHEFIGEISIRLSLTESLLKYGGNIGYGIRYSKFNQGYGTLILKMALDKARILGLKKVLITCNIDNYGSSKVIENNGGVLENIIQNEIDGKTIFTKRYWIEL